MAPSSSLFFFQCFRRRSVTAWPPLLLFTLLFLLLFNGCSAADEDSSTAAVDEDSSTAPIAATEDYSLNDYSCAKKGTELFDGLFTLNDDNRLRSDPSKLPNNGDAKNVLLLVHTKDGSFDIAIVSKKTESCKQFYNDRVKISNCKIPGDETEMGEDHFAKEECEEENCKIFTVSCTIAGAESASLPDYHFFTLSMSKNVSSDEDNPNCDWVAFIDDVSILLKKSEHDSEKLAGNCWKKKNTKTRRILAAVCSLIILMVFSIAGGLLLKHYLRPRKRTDHPAGKVESGEKETVEPEKDEPVSAAEDQLSNADLSACQYGVEVPDSQSDESLSIGSSKSTASTQSKRDELLMLEALEGNNADGITQSKIDDVLPISLISD